MLGYTPRAPSYRSAEAETNNDERQQSEADQGIGVHRSELPIPGHGIDIPSCGPSNDAAEIHVTLCAYATSKGVCRAEHRTTSAFLPICSIRSANSGQRYRSATS